MYTFDLIEFNPTRYIKPEKKASSETSNVNVQVSLTDCDMKEILGLNDFLSQNEKKIMFMKAYQQAKTQRNIS